jgi:hypothetical protein
MGASAPPTYPIAAFEPWHRRAIVLLVAVVVTVSACGSGTANSGSKSSPETGCSKTWAAGWQKWADRVRMPVWCPGWMPSPIDAIIHGQWNTAQVEQHQWQLGYAWLEQGQLVHVIFEGYPHGTFPPTCEGGVPCFGGEEAKSVTIAGHVVHWYDHNQASHSGHIAAVFSSGGNTYVVSIHIVTPVSTKAIAKRDLRHIVESSSLLKPA